MIISIKQQKYLIAFFLFIINLVCSTTFIIYENNWYIYLFILALASVINTFSVFCITGHKMIAAEPIQPNRVDNKNYLYVIPCYNESEKELTDSLNSLTLQRTVNTDKRALLIICDGISTEKNNKESTDVILKKILNIDYTQLGEFFDYKTWENSRNIIKIYNGQYTHLTETLDFILIIKNKNYGKRDSLVLTRKMCFSYNNHNDRETISDSLFKYMFDMFKNIYETNIDYIIGIDADTIFDYNCSYELIQGIEKEENIHGCVGYVDILQEPTISIYSPFILYQYGEYMFSQCLRRYTQSTITKKVNCLSGCNQILRVSKETCGNAILHVLNYLPMNHENIFNHIRSYASEDRNHITHMLSMYPYVKSTQTLKAIAYTSVPTIAKVFISQRRRWNLGAMTNDMLLVYLPNINIFERISSFVNVTMYCFSPFIFIATIFFLKAIITQPTMLMLYLSTIIFIPILYALLIPVFIRPLSFRNSMYYYCAYLFFLSCGSLIKLLTYGYSIAHMDVIKWGKTRSIEEPAIAEQTEESALAITEQASDDGYINIICNNNENIYTTEEERKEKRKEENDIIVIMDNPL